MPQEPAVHEAMAARQIPDGAGPSPAAPGQIHEVRPELYSPPRPIQAAARIASTLAGLEQRQQAAAPRQPPSALAVPVLHPVPPTAPPAPATVYPAASKACPAVPGPPGGYLARSLVARPSARLTGEAPHPELPVPAGVCRASPPALWLVPAVSSARRTAGSFPMELSAALASWTARPAEPTARQVRPVPRPDRPSVPRAAPARWEMAARCQARHREALTALAARLTVPTELAAHQATTPA